jgi:hypothetical protein
VEGKGKTCLADSLDTAYTIFLSFLLAGAHYPDGTLISPADIPTVHNHLDLPGFLHNLVGLQEAGLSLILINAQDGDTVLLSHGYHSPAAAAIVYQRIRRGNPLLQQVALGNNNYYHFVPNLLSYPAVILTTPLLLAHETSYYEVFPDHRLLNKNMDASMTQDLADAAQYGELEEYRIVFTNYPVTEGEAPIDVYNLFGQNLPVYGPPAPRLT